MSEKPVITIVSRNVGIKVFDIELIGMKDFRWGITTNVAKFKFPEAPREQGFILLGLEMIPKGKDKANPKHRINLSPYQALRLAANLLEAVRMVQGWTRQELNDELAKELSPI